MTPRPVGIKFFCLFCLILFSALTACQQGAPVPENQPTKTPPPLEGEALRQRQHQIALESREIVQQIRDSLAALKEQNKIDTAFVRPSLSPDLPDEIAVWLEQQGYWLIPVIGVWSNDYPNVILGDFIIPGQQDLAVYVSDKTNRTLIVFPAKSLNKRMIVLEEPDSNLWMVYRENQIACSAIAIHPVGGEYIVAHYEEFGGPEPPAISHQAINYAILGSASVVYYYHNGQWVELQGAD